MINIKNIFVASLLLAQFCVVAAAEKPHVDPPRAEITVNKLPVQEVYNFKVGSIIRLSFRESVADFISSEVDPAAIQGEPTFLLDEDEKGLSLVSIPGTYIIRVNCSNSRGQDKEIIKIVVGGVIPLPPPQPPIPTPPAKPVPPQPPTPPTPDEPKFPEDRFGLTEKVYTWALAVKSEKRKEEAKALASASAAVKEGIKAGQLKTLGEALAAVLKVNGEVMANLNKEAWKDFGLKLVTNLNTLMSADKINNTQDLFDALNEVEIGLVESTK